MKEVKKSKEQKCVTKNVKTLYESGEKLLNCLMIILIVSEAKYKTKYGEGLIILTPKQMLQRLPITQIKADNRSANLLNEIREIIYSLYRAKQITKKIYNNIMNSVKLQNRLDTIFMNSKNSGISDPHRLLLNLTDKINLKRSDKYVASSNLSIYYSWKNIKNSCENNKFKISAPTWNGEFEFLNGSSPVSDIQDYLEYILKKTCKRVITIQ